MLSLYLGWILYRARNWQVDPVVLGLCSVLWRLQEEFLTCLRSKGRIRVKHDTVLIPMLDSQVSRCQGSRSARRLFSSLSAARFIHGRWIACECLGWGSAAGEGLARSLASCCSTDDVCDNDLKGRGDLLALSISFDCHPVSQQDGSNSDDELTLPWQVPAEVAEKVQQDIWPRLLMSYLSDPEKGENELNV